jgi:hypothetical protein
MTSNLKIVSTNREYVFAQNEDQLAVEVEITMQDDEGGVEKLTRKYHYPLATSKSDIMEDLQKVLDSLKRDREIAAESKKSEENTAQADKTAEELEGSTISN